MAPWKLRRPYPIHRRPHQRKPGPTQVGRPRL